VSFTQWLARLCLVIADFTNDDPRARRELLAIYQLHKKANFTQKTGGQQ
jgi:hypothetical protein